MKRYIKHYFSLKTVLSTFTMVLVAMMLVSSCSSSRSRSVRQMREAKGMNTPYKISKSDKDALTKELFMQSKRANIELPRQEGIKFDPTTGAAIVSEEVTYVNPDNHLDEDYNPTKVGTDTVYKLTEVVVTARSRFTPERDGKVSVDFMVRVPKELISSKWRVTLSPKLLHNDSIVSLQEVVLKGQEFADKQKADHAAYDSYVKSIVGKSAYDSVFLDRANITKDIANRQSFYYDKYHTEWSRQMAYEKWMRDHEKRNETYIIKEVGARDNLYHQHAREANEQAMRDLALGKDTTGIFASYMSKYNKKTKDLPEIWKYKTELRSIPREFEDIYENDRTLADITNDIMTENDSVQIAKHRYFFDKIAENEIKGARKEDKYLELVPFPYEQGVRVDSVVVAGRDFLYYYSQDYPVTVGLKQVRITMSGKVDAIDRSSYHLAKSDTLAYFVSSLSQLVDTTLTHKETKLYRDVFNRMTAYLRFADKKTTFDINYKDNKAELAKVMDTYRTFTTEGKLVVDSIEMTVSNSLDGTFDDNAEQTMKRSQSLKEYFVKTYPEMNAETIIKTYNMGEDWNTLAANIRKRIDIVNKDRILEMLTTAVNPDATEADIKKEFPADFKIIRDSIYPLLNKVDFVFNMHRPGMEDAMTVNREERSGYAEGLQLLVDREYWKAIEILADYPDYNTALCLAAMGYNAKSYDILKGLAPNGNTEYILALVSMRLGKDEEAMQHLQRAVQLDPSKAYRVALDPEIADFVRKNNLKL
ncbi:tetratricopeptide repeat protein [Dysgonomonas sp. ZJ279]|uniref:tetratricopeptide repeat protein n=1 Tax=Dysgonomonas sp. ZJ279 TaxID=2709796 RepID=UPI0013EDE4FE|nr:hypothetical protein [Dysgonomonas sp. ZJ279]